MRSTVNHLMTTQQSAIRNPKSEITNSQSEIHATAGGGVMAFLQVRMGSRRLPGKALMKIHGRSIFERAVSRLQASPAVDAVVALTTRRGEDDAITAECERLGISFYRGPEDDVLARFFEASEIFRPEIVIRATADNPLIEIGSIERIVTALRSLGLDYCMEKDLPYGAATEAMTAEALAKTHAEARDPEHREHVTLYIKEHPDNFPITSKKLPRRWFPTDSEAAPLLTRNPQSAIQNPKSKIRPAGGGFRILMLYPPAAVRRPDFRVTVDTREDFEAIERLIARFPETDLLRPLEDYF